MTSGSTPTLAHLIQQSFIITGAWQGILSAEHVSQLWQTAAEVCSTQGCIAESLANASTLHALLAVDPLQALPTGVQLHCKTSTTKLLRLLPQVEQPVRLLLLFAQLLMTVAAGHTRMVAKIHAPLQSKEGAALLRTAISIKLQQLTELNSCPSLLSPDIDVKPRHISTSFC